MSLADVHGNTGIAISFVSYVERDLKRPSAENLVALCVATGTPVDRAVNLARRGCVDCSALEAALDAYRSDMKVAS